jgi:hypothetical protein
MKYWLNQGHIQFDLLLGGVAQQVVGKMIDCDTLGITLIKESDGTTHSYAISVVQHATPAP